MTTRWLEYRRSEQDSDRFPGIQLNTIVHTVDLELAHDDDFSVIVRLVLHRINGYGEKVSLKLNGAKIKFFLTFPDLDAQQRMYQYSNT